VLRWGSGDFL